MSELDQNVRGVIEDLLTDYAHSIDDDELERWSSFFVEKGLYQIIPREGFEAGHRLGVMLCRGQGMMNDRIQAMRQANIFEPQRYTHILSRPAITKVDGSSYSVRSNFHIVRTMEDGGSEMFVTGRYLDSIQVAGSEARFLERKVLLDSRRIDTLLVVPL